MCLTDRPINHRRTSIHTPITTKGVWRKLWLLCASFLLIPGRPSLLIAASVANPTAATAAATAANSPPSITSAAAPGCVLAAVKTYTRARSHSFTLYMLNTPTRDADAAAPVSVPPTAPGGNKFQSALKGLQQRHQDVRSMVDVDTLWLGCSSLPSYYLSTRLMLTCCCKVVCRCLAAVNPVMYDTLLWLGCRLPRQTNPH